MSSYHSFYTCFFSETIDYEIKSSIFQLSDVAANTLGIVSDINEETILLHDLSFNDWDNFSLYTFYVTKIRYQMILGSD